MAAAKQEKKKLTPQEKEAAGWLYRHDFWWKPLNELWPLANSGSTFPPQFFNALGLDQYRAWQIFCIEKICCNLQEDDWKPPGYQGRNAHFREFVSILFGRPECRRRFLWNPHAVQILEDFSEHPFYAVAGHASSSKSETGAVIGIGEWLLDPFKTKIFITSTTLAESRQRVWGVVEAYWSELIKFFGDERLLPGKLVSSQGIIRAEQDGRPNALAGLALIAGDRSQEKESTTKIGFKAAKVILIADEMPMLSDGLFHAAKSNLFSNPDFRMMGIGNPNSYFDPFGIFSEPEDGWNSVDEYSESWKTKMGFCRRFDGHKSVNVVACQDLWPGLLTREKVNWYKENLGADSPEYWRMVRGFFSPTGDRTCIISEQEITSNFADGTKRVVNWVGAVEKLCFLDPAFSGEGDAAQYTEADFGDARCEDGKVRKVLAFTKTENLMKSVNVKNKELDASTQVANLFKQRADASGIPLKHRGLDVTGGGTPFLSLVTARMGVGVCPVHFNMEVSDKKTSLTDSRTAKERFHNKVTEIWYSMKDFIASGQIRGLSPDAIKEFTSRSYKTLGNGKIQIESKKDMKKRTSGRSPDCADSACGLLQVAIERLGFRPAIKPHKLPPARRKEPEMYADLRPNSGRRGLIRRYAPANLGWGG